MMPIQDLLHRIQWDAGFGRAEFVLGYFDRVVNGVIRVPWSRVRFAHGEHFAIDVQEEDGATHTVPLHRLREVWRDGVLIWQRQPPA